MGFFLFRKKGEHDEISFGKPALLFSLVEQQARYVVIF
jgi:hypothetical protein